MGGGPAGGSLGVAACAKEQLLPRLRQVLGAKPAGAASATAEAWLVERALCGGRWVCLAPGPGRAALAVPRMATFPAREDSAFVAFSARWPSYALMAGDAQPLFDDRASLDGFRDARRLALELEGTHSQGGGRPVGDQLAALAERAEERLRALLSDPPATALESAKGRCPFRRRFTAAWCWAEVLHGAVMGAPATPAGDDSARGAKIRRLRLLLGTRLCVARRGKWYNELAKELARAQGPLPALREAAAGLAEGAEPPLTARVALDLTAESQGSAPSEDEAGAPLPELPADLRLELAGRARTLARAAAAAAARGGRGPRAWERQLRETPAAQAMGWGDDGRWLPALVSRLLAAGSAKAPVLEVRASDHGLPGCSEGGRRTYDSFDLAELNVEELALRHYLGPCGFAYGIHCEGALLRDLFGLLLYHELFDTSVRGVFLSAFQDAPLDLGTEVFYPSRRVPLERRLSQLAAMSPSAICAEVRERFAALHGTRIRGVRWDRYAGPSGAFRPDEAGADACAAGADLGAAAGAVGGRALAAALRLLCADYCSAGLPDLLVWSWPGAGGAAAAPRARFVEVKSERDALSRRQRGRASNVGCRRLSRLGGLASISRENPGGLEIEKGISAATAASHATIGMPHGTPGPPTPCRVYGASPRGPHEWEHTCRRGVLAAARGGGPGKVARSPEPPSPRTQPSAGMFNVEAMAQYLAAAGGGVAQGGFAVPQAGFAGAPGACGFAGAPGACGFAGALPGACGFAGAAGGCGIAGAQGGFAGAQGGFVGAQGGCGFAGAQGGFAGAAQAGGLALATQPGGLACAGAAQPEAGSPQEMEALVGGINAFIQRYPIDQRCYEYLTTSSSAEFRAPREGEADYSPLVTSWVKRMRGQSGEGPGGGAGPADAAAGGEVTQEVVDEFFLKYPCDQRATEYFNMSPREVQSAVVQQFRPRSEGDSDYSAAITSFIRYKSSKGAGKGAAFGGMGGMPVPVVPGVPGAFQRPPGMANPNSGWATADIDPNAPPVDLESFRAQYPMDDRAWDFLSSVDQRIQKRVVETFKVLREGEADYSAKITAYVKTTKQMWHEAVAETALTQEQVDTFFTRYPCDQKATEYFNQISRELQAVIVREFRPRSEGDSDYSAAITSFIKYKSNAPWAAGGKGGGCGGGKGGCMGGGAMQVQQFAGAGMQAGGALTQQEVDSFFTRYPCDQRACEYFSQCSVDVQTSVVRQFRPRSEGDSDYSAAVTAFVKRCSGGGMGGMMAAQQSQQWQPQQQQQQWQPQYMQQQSWQGGPAAKRMRMGM
ncbi:unnamed protein product [Prorocentrum cordatum]|uniref:Fanconi-associated nuclease n=1 Tax=Prorocentrum cordatum TaxID=2364126 RepID=A0ABN9XSQ0_9DINO|nr:unnamed protein product [Polarella glacialis]